MNCIIQLLFLLIAIILFALLILMIINWIQFKCENFINNTINLDYLNQHKIQYDTMKNEKNANSINHKIQKWNK